MSKLGKIFGGDKPKLEPLPPLPDREDPAIEAARKKQASNDLRRRGRRSTILTSGSGVSDNFGDVSSRPRAGAKLLGQNA